MVSNEDECLKERVDCDAAVALEMRLLRRRGVVRGGKEDVVVGAKRRKFLTKKTCERRDGPSAKAVRARANQTTPVNFPFAFAPARILPSLVVWFCQYMVANDVWNGA